METVVQCAKCCLFLFTLQIVFAGSYHDDCIQFESGGLGFTTNWTEIKENNYINLTAYLQETSQCKTNSNNILQIKISYQIINRTVDLCKFILYTACELSDSSNGTSNCKCLDNHTVQFLKKANSSDIKFYTWKWRHGKNPEKHLDIFISVTKGRLEYSHFSSLIWTLTFNLNISDIAAVKLFFIGRNSSLTMLYAEGEGLDRIIPGSEAADRVLRKTGQAAWSSFDKCAQCWLFLFTLRIIVATGYQDDNCIQFDSGALGFTTNWSEIKENNYINLTARLQDTSQCKTNSNNILHIKISYQEINRTMDLCKFILNTTCELSDSSDGTSNCKCLDSHTVQFLKKASSSDSKQLYAWKWRHGQTPEKHFDIFISVTKDNKSTDSFSDASSAAPTTTVVWVVNVVVVAATVGVVLWVWHKVKCSTEVKNCGGCYHSNIPDPAKDNEVNDQTLSHGVDIDYTAVIDHVNTGFSVSRQYRDPSYSDVKEQDMSHPLESSCFKITTEQQTLYACVKKESRGPTNASVEGQQSQPYYVDVEEIPKDKEHDESQHHHLTYVDVNKHDTCQHLHPTYSDINEQHWSQNYDSDYVDIKLQDRGQPTEPSCYEMDTEKKSDKPPCVYVEKKDKSQPLDPTNSDDARCPGLKIEEKNGTYVSMYAHVQKKMKRNPGSSTHLHINKDTNYPDDLVHSTVKQHDENIAFDPTQVRGQDPRQGSEPTYSLINKHNPVQPVNPICVPDKEATHQQDDVLYNHLHEDICQHHDPNYAHVEKRTTKQGGGLACQDVRGDNNLEGKRTQDSQTTSSTTSDNQTLHNQMNSPPRLLLLSL